MSFQKRPLNRLVTSSILFPSKIHEHDGVCRKRVCLSQHARSSSTALLLSLLVQGWFSQDPHTSSNPRQQVRAAEAAGQGARGQLQADQRGGGVADQDPEQEPRPAVV